MPIGTITSVARPTCSSVPMIACSAPPPGVSGPVWLRSCVKKPAVSLGRPLKTMKKIIHARIDATAIPADHTITVMMRSSAVSAVARSRVSRKKSATKATYHHRNVPMVLRMWMVIRMSSATAAAPNAAMPASMKSSADSERRLIGTSSAGLSGTAASGRGSGLATGSGWVRSMTVSGWARSANSTIAMVATKPT